MAGDDDPAGQSLSVSDGVDMDSRDPGKVVAFYSFKGGTGRSMALANVGCILAQHPDVSGQILLVDWDLEAPGLHRYFRRHLYGAFRGSDEQQNRAPGVIDLFIALRDRINESNVESLDDFESTRLMLGDIPLDEYIISTDIPGLHLMKAGCFDSDYASKVGRFDWPAIYTKAPFLLRAFVDRLAANYRYVLIDSRTGLTDTSGICTMLLPEILVAVFTPNRQSLTGVVDLVREAGQYRSQSDDLRPLTVYPLPSRIEASEPTLRQQWRFGDEKLDIISFQRSFETVFKEIYGLSECNLTPYFDDIQIQHVPKYAYGEDIAVIDEATHDRLSLTESFQRFSRKLIRGQLPWEMTGPLSDTESGRALELRPSFEVEVLSVEDQRPPHVLICVHGIKDNAAWCEAVVTARGRFIDTRIEIVCVSYRRLSTLSFILGLRRQSIQADVLHQIEAIHKKFPDSPISILCNSSGTKIISEIMPIFSFKIEWIFLCGSVCRLEDISQLREIARYPVNDAATNDWWPILAESIRPGIFQATGVYGFHAFPVIERTFPYYHGEGMRRKHIERWILPTLVTGVVERTPIQDFGISKHLPVYIRRALLALLGLVMVGFVSHFMN
jgi:cellulose biosynthesis protein BcsQ